MTFPDSHSAGVADEAAKRAGANWCFVGPPPRERQGWKLYISANNRNFPSVLDAVRPVLARHAISYKYVADERVLQRINAGLNGYSQVGKTIVAYLDDDGRALPLLTDIKAALQPFRHSAVLPPFAEPVGDGLPLSYRFGAFDGDSITVNGTAIPDDRNRRMTALEGLPLDPFVQAVVRDTPDEGLGKLLLDFPVYEVLSQSGKGGVYAAMDLGSDTFREVIIKIGRRNGSLLPDGRDGMDLVRREKWFFEAVASLNLTRHLPAIVGYWEFSSSAVLVMELVEGETLQSLRARGALEIAHVLAGLEVLNALHAEGLVAGDAKLGNFILTPSGDLRIIDFESSALIREITGRADQYSTFHFTDKKLEHRPAEQENLHFLYSAIHEESGEPFDERSRVIDLDIVTGYQPYSETAASVVEMMRSILAAIELGR